MFPLFTFLVLILFFTCISAGLLQVLFRRQIHMHNRIQALRTSEEKTAAPPVQEKQKRFVFAKRGYVIFRERVSRHLPKSYVKELDEKLADAGHPFRLTSIDFIMTQLGLAVCFSGLIFLLFASTGELKRVVFLSLISGVFGAYYPVFYLNAKKRQRIIEIEKQMSDFFDLVNVSIEAGMGIDSAIHKVAKEMKGALSAEFLRMTNDIRLGQSRKEAFLSLKERIPVEALRSVVNALVQADQMGISISKTLREQTRAIRESRLQDARERAMKAPIKMMIPMVLFIFPTLFIVLLGPIVIMFITKGF